MKYELKLTLSLIGLAAISTLLAIGIDQYNARDYLFKELQSKVMSISASVASQINGDLVKQVRKLEDQDLPAYKTLRRELRRARNANRRSDTYVKYMYIIYPDPKDPNRFLFVVDPEENEKEVSLPGSENPGSTLDFLALHLNEVYSYGKLVKDPWGTWMTGYAPIYDSEGNYVGSLGTDIGAQFVNAALNRLLIFAGIAFSISMLFAILFAKFNSAYVTRSLRKLQNATLEIEKGNFQNRVVLQTGDEFEDLGHAFNQMSQGLEEKEKLKTGFAHYVSQHVMERILKTKGTDILEGERRKITVFFSDIRDFTRLAESMPPEKVVVFLNDYFKTMLDIIFRHNGMLDKMIGDGIMAEFGVPIEDPEQERNAVLTALEMQETLKTLREEWKKEGRPIIEVGIGIHTGDAIVGTIGSERRMDYTAIGDTVNVASRLEHATKEQNCPIIVSEPTLRGLYNEFPYKALGPLALPGNDLPINAFAIFLPEGKTVADYMNRSPISPQKPS